MDQRRNANQDLRQAPQHNSVHSSHCALVQCVFTRCFTLGSSFIGALLTDNAQVTPGQKQKKKPSLVGLP